jgi:hypothetical protein
MKLVVLGPDSPDKGDARTAGLHALLEALAGRDHDILLLEPAPAWRIGARRRPEIACCRVGHYPEPEALDRWHRALVAADAVIVCSGLRHGIALGRFIQSCAEGLAAFYDMDTPSTLARLERGRLDDLSPDLIAGYDLYLASLGGPVLARLEKSYGSPAARALRALDRGNPAAIRRSSIQRAIDLEAYLFEAGASATLALSDLHWKARKPGASISGTRRPGRAST